MDGREVVTPRDVIELLTRAKQRQQDEFEQDPTGTAECMIGPPAIIYGLRELSKRKKDTLLKAEFPHFWPQIEKFANGKTAYTEHALRKLLGSESSGIVDDLVSIGFLRRTKKSGKHTLEIPFLYRDGLNLTRGLAS
jgi:hypothetical protein